MLLQSYFKLEATYSYISSRCIDGRGSRSCHEILGGKPSYRFALSNRGILRHSQALLPLVDTSTAIFYSILGRIAHSYFHNIVVRVKQAHDSTTVPSRGSTSSEYISIGSWWKEDC
jgi:hypothetical protein